jgi:outer membrane cobalamin receptor
MSLARRFLLLLAGFLPLTAMAQPVVTGVVFDSVTGETIPGVHIIYGPGMGVLTGEDGTFSVNPGPGVVTITMRFVGYKPERRELSLAAYDTIFLEVAMVPAVTTLNEIVISAGRAEQKLSELTVSMSVIKPYILTRNHIVSADDLLNLTPGIEILDGQASIRGGSGYSYGAGSRVLVLIDGMPALSADAGNIKWNSLPLDNISRIEVIKGASSVLYGSSALNGVVNFISREADAEPYTQVVISTSLFDTPRREEWKWWDTPRMTSSATATHSKIYGGTGVSVGLKLVSDNGYRELNDERYARLNLRLKRSSLKNEFLNYGLNISTTLTEKTDFLLWQDADQGALRQNPETAMEYRGTSVSVDPFMSFGNGTVRHSINARYTTNLNRMPGNENNESDAHSLYSEYQFSSGRKGIFSLVSGVTQQYINIGSAFYGDHWGLNIAAYSQLEASPLKWLKGVAGVRLEEFILDGVGDRVIPIFRAGLNATLADATFLRASVGQGYRYPAVAEKHAYTTVGSIKILPNMEIKSESGWSSEIGLKQGFSNNSLSGQVDLALFYSQNEDMIEFVFGYWFDEVAENFTYGFRPRNIENSRVYGVEIETVLNHDIGEINTTLTAGYTFMYPVEFNGVTGRNSDKFLKFRRKHSADLNLTSSYRRVEVGLNLSAKSKILDIDDVFVNELTRETILPGFYDYWLADNKGHYVIDCFAGYRFGTGYQVSAGVKNLTNTEYMGRPGDIQPHRQFSLQISARF